MRGIPEFNFPAFRRAAYHYRDLGYRVISPAEHDEELGLDVTGCDGLEDLEDQGFVLQDALLWDLTQVCLHADGIVLLPGWKNSSGARAEYATAVALGKFSIEVEEEL